MEQLKTDGNEFFISEDFENAIKKYKEAIVVVSDMDDSDIKMRDLSILQLNVSATYCKLKNYESALEHAVESTKLQPDLYKPWYRLSVCLYKLGKNEQALKAIEKTIECSNKVDVTDKYITDLKDSIKLAINNENDDTESEDSDEPDQESNPLETNESSNMQSDKIPNMDSLFNNPMMKDMIGNMQSNGTMPDMNSVSDKFMPMMQTMLGNPKIKEMLDNKSFQEKILQNQSNPFAMLDDPNMKDIMSEMMKGIMNK